jgi:signal peptidase II
MCLRRRKHVIAWVAGSGFVLTLLDQLTKAMATAWLNPLDPVKIIPDMIHLTLVHNPGAAFGVLRDVPNPWRMILFSVISLIALVILVHMFITRPRDSRLVPIAITLIGAGATGNFIDRFRFGYVVDFIDTYPFGYHFPTFNIADSCITIGVTLMMIYLLFIEGKENDAS